MNIMTKRGSEDNTVTYEHYCDTKADLANIPQDQISLGSVAIVLKDEDDSMGIYLANSNKEWISFSTSGGGSSMSDISLANLIDVSLANPNDGDTLVYDATSEKWVAQAGGSGGGGGGGSSNIMIIRPTSYNQYGIAEGFNKTYAEISECLAGDGIPILVGFYENASSKYYYYSNSGNNYHEFIALNMTISQGAFFHIDGVRINSDNTIGDGGNADLAVN